jgi:hypothetical protein
MIEQTSSAARLKRSPGRLRQFDDLRSRQHPFYNRGLRKSQARHLPLSLLETKRLGRMRVNVIGLAAEMSICKQVAKATGGK